MAALLAIVSERVAPIVGDAARLLMTEERSRHEAKSKTRRGLESGRLRVVHDVRGLAKFRKDVMSTSRLISGKNRDGEYRYMVWDPHHNLMRDDFDSHDVGTGFRSRLPTNDEHAHVMEIRTQIKAEDAVRILFEKLAVICDLAVEKMPAVVCREGCLFVVCRKSEGYFAWHSAATEMREILDGARWDQPLFSENPNAPPDRRIQCQFSKEDYPEVCNLLLENYKDGEKTATDIARGNRASMSYEQIWRLIKEAANLVTRTIGNEATVTYYDLTAASKTVKEDKKYEDVRREIKEMESEKTGRSEVDRALEQYDLMQMQKSREAVVDARLQRLIAPGERDVAVQTHAVKLAQERAAQFRPVVALQKKKEKQERFEL